MSSGECKLFGTLHLEEKVLFSNSEKNFLIPSCLFAMTFSEGKPDARCWGGRSHSIVKLHPEPVTCSFDSPLW